MKETTKARTTLCSSLPLLRLSPVGDLASTVESASAAYFGITVAPHEYFDHTGSTAGLRPGRTDAQVGELGQKGNFGVLSTILRSRIESRYFEGLIRDRTAEFPLRTVAQLCSRGPG